MRLTEAGLKLGMAAVLGLAVATGAVAQSAQQALSSESVIETIKKRGALKVGMSTFVPWAMRDKNGDVRSVANRPATLGSANPWFLIDGSRMIKPVVFQRRRDYRLQAMTDLRDELVFSRDEFRYGVDARCNAGYGLWQLAYGSKQPLTAAAFEAAYGLPAFGGRFTGTPHAGCEVSGEARDCPVGWRLGPEAPNAPDVSLGAKATRSEDGTDAPVGSFGIDLTVRW